MFAFSHFRCQAAHPIYFESRLSTTSPLGNVTAVNVEPNLCSQQMLRLNNVKVSIDFPDTLSHPIILRNTSWTFSLGEFQQISHDRYKTTPISAETYERVSRKVDDTGSRVSEQASGVC